MADAMVHGQLHIRPEVMDTRIQEIARRNEAQLDARARKTGRPISAADKSARAKKLATSEVHHDWTPIGDRFYGYWGALAPVLMIPFVALFGLGVSDPLISILFGAINVALFYWLLSRVDRSELCTIERPCRIALTILFAFGTSHLWLACAGQIWFSVPIVTQTFLLLAMIARCSPADRPRDALFAGAAFGAAILGRSVVLSLGLFFVVLMFLRWRRAQTTVPASPDSWSTKLPTLIARVTLFMLPVVAAMGIQGLYNYGRFGDFRQSGLEIQIKSGGNPRFTKNYNEYGAMSAHFVPHNLKYYFWNLQFPKLRDGRRWFDGEGNSVFLMTPPLLYMFLAWRRRSVASIAALAGAVPLIASLMMFLGTGWVQFGPRYLLDCTPMLLLIAAAGMRGRLTHFGFILIAAAIAMQFFGTPRILESSAGTPAAWWATVTSIETLLMLLVLTIIARLGWAGWLAFAAPKTAPSRRN